MVRALATRRSLLFFFPAALWFAAPGAAKEVFKIGICHSWEAAGGAYTTMGKIALDEGYFDSILPGNASSSAFTLGLDNINGECSGSVSSVRALPFLLGQGTQDGRIHSSSESKDPVIGIAGCPCSGSSMPVSSMATNYQVVVISSGATNPILSNKGLHPYFSRVVPPDSMQGLGFAALVREFGWKRVCAAYISDPYSNGIATAFKSKLASAGGGVTYLEYQLDYQPLNKPSDVPNFDHESWREIVDQIAMESPQPRVFFTASHQVDYMMRIFYDGGLLSPSTLWMFADSICNVWKHTIVGEQATEFQAADPEDPFWDFDWMSMPEKLRGMICLAPQAFGPMYYGASFQSFWGAMTREKLVAAGWDADTYWDPAWLTAEYFTQYIYWPMAFDLLLPFIVAIANMLGKGVPVPQIRGEALLTEVRAAKVEGVTGPIGFDENGDRLAPYDVFNMRVNGSNVASLVRVGEFNAVDDSLSWLEPPIFADGTTDVPKDRPDPCQKGFEFGSAVTGCIACMPGTVSITSDSVCTKCTPGYFQASEGQSACEPSPKGYYVDTDGASAAVKCGLGQFAAEKGSISCKSCAAGSFAAQTGMSECEPAPPGSFVKAAGAIQASACPAGYFAPLAGAQMCTPCLAGFFQSALGQIGCERCEVSTFSSPASSQCTSCAAGMMTLSSASSSPEDCQCPLGQFCDGVYPACKCRACPVGMECPFGAKAQHLSPFNASGNPPLVRPQYYTKAEDPLSVFMCHPSFGLDRCPGGGPAECLNNFNGLTCTGCPDGYAAKGSRCAECSDGNIWVFAVAPIIGVVVCVVTYYTANIEMTTDPTTIFGVSAVIGLVVTIMQLFATFDQLTTPWPQGLQGFFHSFSFFGANPKVFSSECVSTSGASAYLLRFLLPYLVAAIMGLCYIGAKVLGLVGALPIKWQWGLPMVINTTFHIYQAIFIALAMVAAAPFQCYSHPNGDSGLVQYPDVLCGSEEHRATVAMAVILMLTFLVPYIGFQIWGNCIVRKVGNDPARRDRHLKMFQFLMYRFRPDVWWWGTAFTVRQTLLAFSPMVEPDDPHAQSIFIVAVLVIYLALACFFWPWKSHDLNMLDSISMVVITLLVSEVTAFMPASEWDPKYMAAMIAQIVVLGVLGISRIGYGCYQAATTRSFCEDEAWQKRPEGVKQMAQDLVALSQKVGSAPIEDLVMVLLTLNSYDLRKVRGALDCFAATSVESYAATRMSTPARLTGLRHSSTDESTIEAVAAKSAELAAQVSLPPVQTRELIL